MVSAPSQDVSILGIFLEKAEEGEVIFEEFTVLAAP